LEYEMLAVRVPTRRDEARLWTPAVREEYGVAGEHPREVDALVDDGREAYYLSVFAEELARGQHAREQQRRVDGGCLAVPTALARRRVHPV
jgi:hypothetical protein